MEFRFVGNSGLQVSAIGLGANNFGGRTDEAGGIRVVKTAIEEGITAIDTADVYGGGLSEEIIGKAIKGERHRLVLMTKSGMRYGQGPHEGGASRLHLVQSVETSLRKLGADHIDLYQLHFPDPYTPIEETLRALDDMVRQGKIRYIGCSNYLAWQACEAAWTSRSLGLNSYISVQPHYSLYHRAPERGLMSFCQAYNVGIIPYYPLAKGLLTGKYRVGEEPAPGTRLSDVRFQGILNDANYEVLGKLEKFAGDRGRSVLDLAFAWLLARPQVCTVIAGATKPEQVRANAAAAGWSLTQDEVAELDRITERYIADSIE